MSWPLWKTAFAGRNGESQQNGQRDRREIRMANTKRRASRRDRRRSCQPIPAPTAFVRPGVLPLPGDGGRGDDSLNTRKELQERGPLEIGRASCRERV